MQDRIKSVIALAAPSVALGVFFSTKGYTRTGWTFIGVALLIFATALISTVVPALLAVLLWVSAPLRWIGNFIWRFAVRNLSEAKRKLQAYLPHGGPMYDFVAQTPRVYMHSQQADFKLIARPEGSQFRGLGFVIRPDYQFNYWRAGLRLVRRGEDLSQGDIGDTVLFHIAANEWGVQPTTAMIVHRRLEPGGIQHYGATRWPSFRISGNVWSTANPARMRIGIMVEAPDASPVEVEFDAADMDSIALIAWGDGYPFRVFFDDVRIYWRNTQ